MEGNGSAFRCMAVCALVLGLTSAGTSAQGTRAARLTFADGNVHVDSTESIAQGNAGDPAQLNMPLVEGQTVVTGDNGQAEVEFEDGSLARLTPNSALRLAHLTTDGSNLGTQLVLSRGLAYFELRSAPHFTFTVTAEGDQISPVENTTFRVNVDQPPAAVAVLDGMAHIVRAGSYAVDLRGGESFRGEPAEPGRYFLTQEIASDTWDQWNEARDQMAADAASQNTDVREGFAGNQGYGWSDLDANGQWYDVQGQGRVWQPAGGDTADFDPYGNGSWVWYPTAGYVWASSYSWGWTPYRCGGWSYWDSFGWGWTPNAACGSFGFAGYGGSGYGGYGGRGGNHGPLNIVLPPVRYRGPRLPPPNHGGIHPILAIHETTGLRRVPPPSGTRMIGGIVAAPLTPLSGSYTSRGGSAIGSSLRRDYPVDRATRTPMLGIQPGQAGARQGLVSGARPGVQQPVQGIPRLAPPITPGVNSGLQTYPQQRGMQNGNRQQGYPQHGYVQPGSGQPGYAQPGYAPRSTPQGVARPTQGIAPQGGVPHNFPQPAPRMSPPQMAPPPMRSGPPPAAAPRPMAAPPGAAVRK